MSQVTEQLLAGQFPNPTEWDELVIAVPPHFWEHITVNVLDDIEQPMQAGKDYMTTCLNFARFIAGTTQIHTYITPETLRRLNTILAL